MLALYIVGGLLLTWIVVCLGISVLYTIFLWKNDTSGDLGLAILALMFLPIYLPGILLNKIYQLFK